MTTDDAGEARVWLIGGPAVGVGRLAEAAGGAERALFLSLAPWRAFREQRPDLPAEVVAFDPVIPAVEAEAHDLAETILSRVTETARPGLAIHQRQLANAVLTPLLKARAQAHLLAERVPAGAEVVLDGFSAAEEAGIRTLLPGRDVRVLSSRPEARPERRPSSTAMLLGFLGDRARHLARAGSRRVARQWAEDVARRRLLVLTGQASHRHSLGRAVSTLRTRGWRALEADRARGGRARGTGMGDTCVALEDFRRLTWAGIREYARGDGSLVPLTLLTEHGLERHRLAIEARVARWAYLEGPATLEGVRALLAASRPDAVLTVSDAAPETCAIAVLAQEAGLPVVAMQQGYFPASQASRRVPFATECLFGDAYKEALIAAGRDADGLPVTGDPRLDAAGLPGRRLGDTSDPLVKYRRHTGEKLVVFAAQRPDWRLSQHALYSSLLAVLDAAATLGVGVVLKMHPAGTETAERCYTMATQDGAAPPRAVLREIDFTQVVRAGDVLAMFGSSVAFEAAALRKPIVVVNLSGRPDELPFAAEGVGLGAYTPDDVLPRLQRALEGFRPEAAVHERFDERWHFRADGKAAERVADVVERLAELARG